MGAGGVGAASAGLYKLNLRVQPFDQAGQHAAANLTVGPLQPPLVRLALED